MAENKKPVVAIEYSTGIRIHYISSTAAALALDIPESDILTVLSNKQRLTHGWRFMYDDPNWIFEVTSDISNC